MRRRRLLASAVAGAALVAGMLAAPARAAGPSAAQSDNWFGYGQNVLATGNFVRQVSATWHVPTVHQRVAGQAENSAVWTGVGGGCLGSNCSIGATDETLIQAGTEQDVNADGSTSYMAWWEAVPAPEVAFANLAIHPGDGVRTTVAQTGPEIWTVTVDDVTDGQSGSATVTVPYASDYSTAEWIVETPLLLGANAGFAALPAMSTVQIQNALVDGQPALLRYPAQAIDLIDANGNVVAAPSPPTGARGDRFDACAQPVCAAPH